MPTVAVVCGGNWPGARIGCCVRWRPWFPPSVVFPDAQLKLYITASARVRAERRVRDIGGDVDEVEASIVKRDRVDSSRAHSPLTESDDAIIVDTTGMSIDEVVAHVMEQLP